MANRVQLGTVECVSPSSRYHASEKLQLLMPILVMIAENVSVGILSLPSAVATLGMVPYVSSLDRHKTQWLTMSNSAAIMILFISALSWYTGYVIGQFKLRHPEVHSMGDAGEILMGPFGRELLGIGQLLLLIFLMASNILMFNILMNVLTDHGTCTLVFGVVGLIICFLGALPRTMDKVYWMSVICEWNHKTVM
jgi:hypothetical protein